MRFEFLDRWKRKAEFAHRRRDGAGGGALGLAFASGTAFALAVVNHHIP
jgi:hypothetical protein